MSYIIQDSWHVRQVNSHSDMALMYQLEMNGQNNSGAVPVSYTHLTLPTTPYV